MAMPFAFDLTRRRVISTASAPIGGRKSVVYWMSRDQRAQDNWALLYAHYLAAELGDGTVVKVVFNLVPRFLEATIRQYGFMIAGLAETEAALRLKHIPMVLLQGSPSDTLPEFVKKEQPAAVVTDFTPLRVPTAWVSTVAAALDAFVPAVPLFQVDAHNVVPVWVASDKQEVGARTIRRKIESQLPRFLTEFPELPANSPATPLPEPINWEKALASLEIDRTVPEVTWVQPGAAAANATLERFIKERLNVYTDQRNNPTENAVSDLSPYFHFGQLAPQRAAWVVKKSKKHADGIKAFVEEAVVRRELSDNFCFYNTRYDSIDGAALWAQETLRTHASDKREYVYTRDELDGAQTHDPLWNAAQLQLVTDGKMHGFLRMYWAKKILEWTSDPESALAFTIYLNDRYSLDGRDPNGFVGCMWSICGVHDMGWKERPIFGKIRYMNYAGCKRKFKVDKFEARYPLASASASAKAKGGPLDAFVKGKGKGKRMASSGGRGGGPAKKAR